MCQSTFRIQLPAEFATMADGSPAFGDAVCGEFFPPTEDVEFCPECHQNEMDYLESLGPGGEDAPQYGNPNYNAGF